MTRTIDELVQPAASVTRIDLGTNTCVRVTVSLAGVSSPVAETVAVDEATPSASAVNVPMIENVADPPCGIASALPVAICPAPLTGPDAPDE